MDKIEIATIDKSTIFKPTFINTIQSRLYKKLEKFPKGQKFRLIIEPVEKKSDDESFTDLLNKYLEFKKPSDEEMKQLKEIPSDDLKQMISDWWDRCVVQMNELRNEVIKI